MIRAVVRNGVIQPLEPVPADWNDGRAVIVEELEETADTLEKWTCDMNALTAELDDPEEWQRIESALAEAGRLAKTQAVRVQDSRPNTPRSPKLP
jgi:ABC-type transporter Mla subunit MlaD